MGCRWPATPSQALQGPAGLSSSGVSPTITRLKSPLSTRPASRPGHPIHRPKSKEHTGGDVAEAPALLEHTAHGGGVAVAQFLPSERPGVAAIVAQQAGGGIQ